MYSALGLGLGILVHITYSFVGIGFVIAKSILLFNLIKFLGAGYLIYIGVMSLLSQSSKLELAGAEHRREISKTSAIRMGFLTNVTNPKATLFFLSLFTLVIDPSTPLFVKLIMGIEMTVVTSLWFMMVAFLVSHHFIKSRVNKIQHFSEKFIGVVLIGLGIKVALSHR